MVDVAESRETRGPYKRLKFSKTDLQLRVIVKPPQSDSQYTMTFRCVGARYAASPTDFNAISIAQVINEALREKFGGNVVFGGKNDIV